MGLEGIYKERGEGERRKQGKRQSSVKLMKERDLQCQAALVPAVGSLLVGIQPDKSCSLLIELREGQQIRAGKAEAWGLGTSLLLSAFSPEQC